MYARGVDRGMGEKERQRDSVGEGRDSNKVNVGGKSQRNRPRQYERPTYRRHLRTYRVCVNQDAIYFAN